MSGRVALASKYPGETCNRVFDFTSQLGVGETISAASVTASVYSGVDPAPSGLIASSAAVSGAQVTQLLTAGVLGVVYELNCSAATSANETLQLTAYLAVVPELV